MRDLEASGGTIFDDGVRSLPAGPASVNEEASKSTACCVGFSTCDAGRISARHGGRVQEALGELVCCRASGPHGAFGRRRDGNAYRRLVSLIDDMKQAAAQFNAWLNSVTQGLTDWAASQGGQEVLLGLDFMSLSSRIGDFYAHIGWYLPVHPSLHRYVLEHLEFSAPFDRRHAADLVGPGSRHWPWIVDGVLASPSVQSRVALVEDGIFCLDHGRWHAAVCSMLPVIEGVVSDRAGVVDGIRVGRRLDKVLNTETCQIVTLSAVPALSVLDAELFERRDFKTVGVAETALNRHLILHGRTVGFGSKVNASRTFMVLVALIELLDGAIVLRTESAPIDTGSFLDDYGPLATLRKAALHSRHEPRRRTPQLPSQE